MLLEIFKWFAFILVVTDGVAYILDEKDNYKKNGLAFMVILIGIMSRLFVYYNILNAWIFK